MKMTTLIKAGAIVQLARMALGRRRRVILRRQQRRNRTLGALALVAGGAAAYWVVSEARARRSPEWPSKKKLRKEARREEAMRREMAMQNRRPSQVHVERDATTELKAPLGDLKH